MADHNILGQKGEEVAVAHFINNGYKILKRNWFYQKYEIDIIACNEDFIVFVEVKTRSSDQWGNPEDAVSKKKIKHIVDAADYFLKENDIDLPARFDIVSVIWTGKNFEVEHLDDAFLPPIN
ncbi:YraN family protein [Dysgonomonas sp. BGC7]|uniref:YraN family protein n=1 Tax=Dysgonomonas sp. BGC7 TaxID=1658008 RepID=UPI00067FB54B|nr:YraN family protein [Dysgonomonas sp. BGC7]MBD8389257.1 YraN family protein [Dysgonomonas sp. BGC7]